MRVLMSLGHKDFTIITGNGAFSMPPFSLMSMGTPVFYFKIEPHMINIQWTKFERKSMVTFISEKLP